MKQSDLDDGLRPAYRSVDGTYLAVAAGVSLAGDGRLPLFGTRPDDANDIVRTKIGANCGR